MASTQGCNRLYETYAQSASEAFARFEAEKKSIQADDFLLLLENELYVCVQIMARSTGIFQHSNLGDLHNHTRQCKCRHPIGEHCPKALGKDGHQAWNSGGEGLSTKTGLPPGWADADSQ